MRSLLSGLIIISLSGLFTGCEKTNFETESGVRVTYLEKGNGNSLRKDSVILMVVHIRTIADKTLSRSNREFPIPHLFDPDRKAGDYQEVLRNLNVGDSVYFETTAKNLYEETYNSKIPTFLIPESTIKIDLKVEDQITYEEFEQLSKEKQG